ncbi:MAG: amidohydrolase family protein [Streptosporangiales bacterium]|nr:amidohydrolase family protein [Streptosporangiales bacterium]
MTELPLLAGAVDLHRHGFPEMSLTTGPPRDDVEDLDVCREAAGMNGEVLKSHLWPSVGRAYLLAKQVPGLAVYGSITLNSGSGGLSPAMVELAALQGARVVYLPTWSSANDQARCGISRTLGAELQRSSLTDAPALPVVDANGRLLPEVRDCLAVAADFGMPVYTGHLAVAEALAVAESGLATDRLVFSHPDSHSIGATWDEAAAIADAGACVEVTAVGIYPRIARTTPAALAELVGAVGAHRCVLTSDYFFPWSPPSTWMLLDLAEGLIDSGVDREGVRAMLVDNPRRLLGLSEYEPAAT